MVSDFSSKPWRNLPRTRAIHMATRRPAHNTPIHMDLVRFIRMTEKGVKFKGVAFMTVSAVLDGFGGFREHLALLLLVLQNTGRRGSFDGFDGFGGPDF